MSIDKYGKWWFCATEEEGFYVAGAGDKELTNLITREQAQLIASAPHLLQAMKIALNVLDATGATEEANAARAAIARAED
jgi:hypothetical protein